MRERTGRLCGTLHVVVAQSADSGTESAAMIWYLSSWLMRELLLKEVKLSCCITVPSTKLSCCTTPRRLSRSRLCLFWCVWHAVITRIKLIRRCDSGRGRTFTQCAVRPGSYRIRWNDAKLECGPMSNVMVALPEIGGALCSTPQSLAHAHYLTAVQ